MKLNDKLQKEIVEYIEAGNYAKHACQAVGISERTFINWKNRGKKASELESKGEVIPLKEIQYLEFFHSIKKAQSIAILKNVETIQKAAKKTWQAAAWWLERTRFQDFGRKDNVGIRFDTPLEVKRKDLEKELRDKLKAISEKVIAKNKQKRKRAKKGY